LLTSSVAATVWPQLHDSIKVHGDLDVNDLWDRFEVFEALHHTMSICNPLSREQLDDAIDVLELTDGCSVIDAACGYGELLLRSAEAAEISGIGIDLSPWMISTAATRAEERARDADLRWVLGEAQRFDLAAKANVAVCVGAEWVWHDINGTIRALREMVAPNGMLVVGAARRHFAATNEQVSARGRIESVEEIEAMFTNHSVRVRHRIDPDDAAWDEYLNETKLAAEVWANQHPGPRADKWQREQRDWQDARDRDREIIGWSLWIASC